MSQDTPAFSPRALAFKRHGFQYLLMVFLVFLLVGPFLEDTAFAKYFMDICVTGILVLAAHAIDTRRRLLPGTRALLIITMSVLWLNSFGWLELGPKPARILLLVFLTSLIYSFFAYVFSARRVDGNLISATLCLYLLLGLAWGTAYALLEAFIPGSFQGHLIADSQLTGNTLSFFQYFSYVTLTSLGYGDILPATQQAAGLCQLEAIIGQFFTAVVVARLVGVQVSQQFAQD